MALFTRHSWPTMGHRKGRLAKRPTILMMLAVLAIILPFLQARPAAAAPIIPLTVSITRFVEILDEDPKDDQHCGDYFAAVTIDGQDEQNSVIIDGNTATCDNRPAGTPYTIDFTDPSFTFTRNVDAANGFAKVTIEMLDYDLLANPDDRMDINPLIGSGNAETMLILTVDLTTGNWVVDNLGIVNQQVSTGASDPDDPKNGIGTVFFTISTSSSSGDVDGDGLFDGWEINGFQADGDGIVDVNLPTMGANPQRKDLFLEIDCLVATNHTHCPLQGAIQTVVQSFADAPVNNVDGTTGIQLHIDIGNLYSQPALPAAGFATNVPRALTPAGSVSGNFGNFGGGGNQIQEAGNLIVDWDGATGSPATNFFSLKVNNFSSLRDSIFRYAIFVHQTNARAASNDCTSGWAKGIPSVNFLVSLGGTGTGGGACWVTDTGGNSVGNQNQQAGTLQHEFGHTLGLGHGGGDGINNKPNYLSVMNYGIGAGPVASPNQVQFCLVPAVGGLPGGCDYSRIALPNLTENLNANGKGGLDECAGIGLGLGGFDWDGDSSLEGITNCQPPNNANVQADINGDGLCVTAGTNTALNTTPSGDDQIVGTSITDGSGRICNSTANGDDVQNTIVGQIPSQPNQLNGFEDWNSISYNFRTIPNFQTAGTPVEDEADPDTIIQARASLAQQVHPVLDVNQTGSADATPGDTLNYTIQVKNSGHGPALNSVLTDTRPDSTQAVFNLGTLVVGAEETRNVSYTVPCSTADQTVLTNSATATAEDLIGNPVSGSHTMNTTVHAPSVTLAKTATASVNAGEAINYTITYQNTGGAAAANVVISDTLPADVYYSNSLDLGAGSKPDTVTLNGDGTRTLVWNVGAVPASSGPQTIVFTARPTLLALKGTSYTNRVSVSFQNGNGCVYQAVNASASTSISVVPPTRDPQTQGFWRNHPELWSAEILARIQATDQRYDTGAAPGQLSSAEVTTVFLPGGSTKKVLETQLLATYFNLATRRINAGTAISSRTADRLGLTNVRDAALYATATLLLPLDATTQGRYSDAISVLEEINANKSEVY
jgi:uncharacterized repeat protein (TIGR01451 family)